MNFKPGDMVMYVRPYCCGSAYLGKVFVVASVHPGPTRVCYSCKRDLGPGVIVSESQIAEGFLPQELKLMPPDDSLKDEPVERIIETTHQL